MKLPLLSSFTRLLCLPVACLGLLVWSGCQSAPPVVRELETGLPSATIESPALEEASPSASAIAATQAYPAPRDRTPTPINSAYPVPPTPARGDAPIAYPAPGSGQVQPEVTVDDPATATAAAIFMPVVGEAPVATETPTAAPSATATATAVPTEPAQLAAAPSPTPIRVVDFEAIADALAQDGRQLAFNKIGFHVTFLEERDELDAYMQRLDSEGVPFFLKSVDNAEPLFKAQELSKSSGVPHTLVFRSTMYDVPNYDLPPRQAAEQDWELEKALWPPELDPGMVWFETMNEVDKNRSEWLAEFALRTAELALRDGYNWAAFGWASGEPEPEDWQTPAMLELLRLIGDNPDQLAIALHEYSYTLDDIGHEYPHKVGRFLDLFRIADEHAIPRPTVLITEWGWTYDTIPPEPVAMEDITWAAELYGAFPEVKGAAVWNIGRLDDRLLDLNTQLQDLIDNMLALSLDTSFSAPLLPEQTAPDAELFPPPGR